MFKQGSPEAWLKFQTNLQKIIKGQILKTGPQWYAITKNLLMGESLRVFEQQATYIGNETEDNYKVVIKGLTDHSLPPKALLIQKRYLHQGMYKPQGIKMREFIYHIKEMVD